MEEIISYAMSHSILRVRLLMSSTEDAILICAKNMSTGHGILEAFQATLDPDVQTGFIHDYRHVPFSSASSKGKRPVCLVSSRS